MVGSEILAQVAAARRDERCEHQADESERRTQTTLGHVCLTPTRWTGCGLSSFFGVKLDPESACEATFAWVAHER